MKTTEIKHKLRKIKLAYKEPVKSSEYETNLIEQYVALHDELGGLYDDINRLQPVFEKIKQQVGKLNPRVKKLLDSYKKHKKYAEEVKFYVMVDYKEIQRFFEMVFENNKKIEILQEELLKLNDLMLSTDKEFDGCVERTEILEKSMENFDNLMNELYNNYNSYSLDLVTFDDDVDDFRGCYGNFDDDYNICFDLRETTVNGYNDMINEVRVLYKLVEDVDAEMINIRERGLFTDSSDEFKDINLN